MVRSDGLSGVLLVGGASSRFGSPKALAQFGAETLAEGAWRLLGEVCDERLAVGKRSEGLELPFQLVDDGTDVQAPLAGLVAGLRAAAYEICVVLPVDCLAMTPEAVRALGEACRDAAVPPTGPLPGAYSRRVLPALERRLAAGDLRLRDALAELETRVVELDEALLVNVNERSDMVYGR